MELARTRFVSTVVEVPAEESWNERIRRARWDLLHH